MVAHYNSCTIEYMVSLNRMSHLDIDWHTLEWPTLHKNHTKVSHSYACKFVTNRKFHCGTPYKDSKMTNRQRRRPTTPKLPSFRRDMKVWPSWWNFHHIVWAILSIIYYCLKYIILTIYFINSVSWVLWVWPSLLMILSRVSDLFNL